MNDDHEERLAALERKLCGVADPADKPLSDFPKIPAAMLGLQLTPADKPQSEPNMAPFLAGENRQGMPHGVATLHWKDGGTSVASIGFDKAGFSWYAPSNWCGGVPCFDWSKVERVEMLAVQDEQKDKPTVAASDPYLGSDGAKWAEILRLREELEGTEKSCNMHADLNRRAHIALGGTEEGEGSSWHDIPERIEQLREQLAESTKPVQESAGGGEFQDDPEDEIMMAQLKKILWLEKQLADARENHHHNEDMDKWTIDDLRQRLEANNVAWASDCKKLAEANGIIDSYRSYDGKSARIAELEAEMAKVTAERDAMKADWHMDAYIKHMDSAQKEIATLKAAFKVAEELNGKLRDFHSCFHLDYPLGMRTISCHPYEQDTLDKWLAAKKEGEAFRLLEQVRRDAV